MEDGAHDDVTAPAGLVRARHGRGGAAASDIHGHPRRSRTAVRGVLGRAASVHAERDLPVAGGQGGDCGAPALSLVASRAAPAWVIRAWAPATWAGDPGLWNSTWTSSSG